MNNPPIDENDPLYCNEILPPVEEYFVYTPEMWDYYVETIVPLMDNETDNEEN